MRVSAHPGLYDPDTQTPTLRGTRCDACGSVFFPPLGIGCEVCGAGADRLLSVPLAAAGVVHSVATVHLHAGDDISVPFSVAEVQLDDGPLIRGTLADPVELDAIGRRVDARWFVVRTDSAGTEIIEPRFTIVPESRTGGEAS